ncbi:P-loop NTPase [Peptococcaceae bacterium 1198_IL3148]
MNRHEIVQQVKEMSVFCDVEGIADALKITPQAVQDILDGKDIEIQETEVDNQPVIQVKTTTMVHRQKIIAVWRAKGGVGATSVAMTLARQISEKMTTILLDLNFEEGGSDLLHYLDMPRYPQMKLPDNIWDRVEEVQNNLYVMHPITHVVGQEKITPQDIQQLILNARQEFDAIVLDLPNGQDECILEAVKNANALALVMTSGRQEGFRAAKLASMFNSKKQIFVANAGLKEKQVKEVVPAEQIIVIPYDKSLDDKLEKQIPVSVKSPFYHGVKGIYETIFDEEFDEVPEGKFKELIYNTKGIFKRSKKKSRPVINRFKDSFGAVGSLAGSIFYAGSLLLVVVAALITIDSVTDINIPFINLITSKLK